MTSAAHGLQVLIGYFQEMISHTCSAAGSNDMPQEAFEFMSVEDKTALLADFHIWDKKTNPQDWEHRSFENIPDFSWTAYMFDRCAQAFSIEPQSFDGLLTWYEKVYTRQMCNGSNIPRARMEQNLAVLRDAVSSYRDWEKYGV